MDKELFNYIDWAVERKSLALESEIAFKKKRVKYRKAPGPDDVPIELLKLAGEAAVDMMHSICTIIWESEQWPGDWPRLPYISIPNKGEGRAGLHFRAVVLNHRMTQMWLLNVVTRFPSLLDLSDRRLLSL